MKSNEWKECKIGELGDVIGGSTPSTKVEDNYKNGKIAWITPKDLSDFKGRYIYYGSRNITELGLKSCSTQLMPKNSILFTSRAPIGYIAIAGNELCTNQGFKSIIPNQNTDYMFLYYLLKFNKTNIENMGSGTTFKEVSGNTMKNIIVSVPKSIVVQKKIAQILSSLDDKIELNNKINDNLEQQAQAIFKSWFSNKKSNGKLFDVLIEMQKSKIKVSDAKNISGDYPFFTSGQAILKYPNFLVDGRYIFMNTGGNAGINFYIGKASYSTDTWCICAKENMTDMLYLLLKSMLLEINAIYFEGSALKHLQKQQLKDVDIYIPNKQELEKFNQLVIPLFNQIVLNKQENERLAQLRDTLLPKLMRGEIDVDKVEV